MTASHLATITPGADPLGRDNTVSLCDGSVVSTWSPAWRAECLERHRDARDVLAMSSQDVRRRHLETLGARRGATYRARLEAEIMTLWRARRAAIASSGDPDA
jgi:hypothetical protein